MLFTYVYIYIYIWFICVYIIRFYRVTNNSFSSTSTLPRFASSKLFFTIDLDFFLGASSVIVCPKWLFFPLETEWKLRRCMIWIDLVRPMDLETSISGSQLFPIGRRCLQLPSLHTCHFVHSLSCWFAQATLGAVLVLQLFPQDLLVFITANR